MGIVIWIIVGAIVGWISGLMTGRADSVGCLSSVILGVAGTVVGGLITSLFVDGGISSFAMQPLVIGLIVAILLLGAGNALLGTVETTEVSS